MQVTALLSVPLGRVAFMCIAYITGFWKQKRDVILNEKYTSTLISSLSKECGGKDT